MIERERENYIDSVKREVKDRDKQNQTVHFITLIKINGEAGLAWLKFSARTQEYIFPHFDGQQVQGYHIIKE